MKKYRKHTDLPGRSETQKEKDSEGYPVYPESEDIYSKCREERELDPEDISKSKESPEKKIKSNEKDFNDDVSGSDLDVPGSELDDNQEIIGNEDEENNYYSLGGDDHNDLEEDKGE
jgi:hypothetical protein